jgi:hypothetical protein
MVPVTDISAHRADGLSLVATADVAYSNNVAKMALWPMTIMTDNVASGAAPTATLDNRVYINDSRIEQGGEIRWKQQKQV